MTKEHPCGPDDWKNGIPWMFRLHAPQFVFRGACKLHDIRYAMGGNEQDRKYADREFYLSMKRAIDERKGWIWRTWLRFWARVYYDAVREYGEQHFNYA